MNIDREKKVRNNNTGERREREREREKQERGINTGERRGRLTIFFDRGDRDVTQKA